MRFSYAKDAILFWWGCVQDGGVPLQPQNENPYAERVQKSLTRWVPHDVLCAYLEVGKAIERLDSRDRRVIKSWLLDVVGVDGNDNPRIAFSQWRYRNHFHWSCRRLWKLLPRELKHARRRRKQSPDPSRNSMVPKSKCRNGIPIVKAEYLKGFQGGEPVAHLSQRP